MAVKTYILNHPEDPCTVRSLARRAAMGGQRFREGFYALFDMTAGAYVREARMQTARFLLTLTSKSVKEIAMICGYSKARNFSTAYKKYFGRSPRRDR